MQNTLLVGLSKQMVLERQLDVVANNIANANTNGYKADRSLFQEYLSSNAHEDNFAGNDRRVSFVQDRATYRDRGGAAGILDEVADPHDVVGDGDAGAQCRLRDDALALALHLCERGRRGDC